VQCVGGRRKVRLELVKPSDDTTSEQVDFFYTSQVAGFDTNNFAKENNFYINVGGNQPISKQDNKKIKLERSDSLLSQPSPTAEILIPNIPKITYNCDPVYEDLSSESERLRSVQTELDPFKLSDNDNLLCFDKTVENLSGKIESFSLSDAIDTSLNMDNGDYLGHCSDYRETRRSSIKRNRMTAALESGSSDLIHPKQSTLFTNLGCSSSTLHTPGNSSELNHQNLSKYLTNCSKINDL